MPTLVTPPEGEPAATAAAHAAAHSVREDHAKQIKTPEEWERRDEKALAEIQLAVKPHLRNIVSECRSAAEAWNCLRVLFEDNTTSRRAELEHDLQNLKLGAGESIIKFVGRAKGIRNDLATAGVHKDDHDLSLAILAGLPAGYGMLATVLKNKDIPLRLPMVTARILITEKELVAVMREDVTPAVQAYLASLNIQPGKKKTQDTRKPVCFYCKKPGHKIAECMKRKATDKKKGGGRGEDKVKGDDKKLAYAARIAPKVAALAADSTQPDEWVVDSGTTHHMARGGAPFTPKVDVDDLITTASGGTLAANNLGVATVVAEGVHDSASITLKDTYRVPGLKDNLLSVGRVDVSGGAVLFAHRPCFSFDNAGVVATPAVINKSDAIGKLNGNGQHTLGGCDTAKEAMMASPPVLGTATVWHRRFFHLSYPNLKKVATMVDGMPPDEVTPDRVAGAVGRPCVEGKLTRAPFPAASHDV